MTVTSLSSESQKATPHPVTTVSRERAHPKTRTLGERGLARRVSPPNGKRSRARFKPARSMLLGTGPAGDPEGSAAASEHARGEGSRARPSRPDRRAPGSGSRRGVGPPGVVVRGGRRAPGTCCPRAVRSFREAPVCLGAWVAGLGHAPRARGAAVLGIPAHGRLTSQKEGAVCLSASSDAFGATWRAELAQRVFVCLFANLFSSPSQAGLSTGTATCTLRT